MMEQSVPAEAAPSASAPRLVRQLGLSTATAVVVAEVIGVGIFLTTADMAKSLGSPFWLLAVWLTTGLAAAGGAICFGALASRWPRAGGPYVYLKEAYGPRIAFLFGWLSMLLTDPGVTAALAVGLASYVGYLVALSPWGLKAVAVASIWLPALINILGVRIGSGMIRVLAALKLGLLFFLVVWGLGLGRGDWSNLVPLVERRPGSPTLSDAIIGGMIAAFFSMGGWWDASKIAGEVRDPRRNVPRALLFGVLLVTLVYILISLVFLYLVPLDRIKTSEAFAALAGEALFGRAGGMIFTCIVLVSVFGSLAAVLMAMPRLYFAMARDGLFFPGVAALHPRFQTPVRATLIQASLASLLAILGKFEEILGYFTVPTVLLLLLAIASVFPLSRGRARGQAVEPLAVPWFPLPPLLFMVPTLALVVLMTMNNPRNAGIGIGVVLLGIPVYHLFQDKLTPSGTLQLHEPPHPASTTD